MKKWMRGLFILVPLIALAGMSYYAFRLSRASPWAVHLAADRGDWSEVMRLVRMRHALCYLGNNRESLLFKALAAKRTDVVECLLQCGADPNAVSSWEEGISFTSTALGRAIFTGNNGLVKLLLEHGARADASVIRLQGGRDMPDPGGSYLCYAVTTGDPELVKMLLDHGANPNAMPTIDGKPLSISAYPTPLRNAVESQTPNPRIVELLLKNGANPNDPGPATSLLEYVRSKHLNEIAALLVKHGAKEPTVSAVQAPPAVPVR